MHTESAHPSSDVIYWWQVAPLWLQTNTHKTVAYPHTHTHTHPFNGPLSVSTRVSRYQKGKTNLDFTEARHSDWQWHQLDHMQVCTSLQTDNHASTPPLSFLQAGCPSCHPTNSIKALKALYPHTQAQKIVIKITSQRNQAEFHFKCPKLISISNVTCITLSSTYKKVTPMRVANDNSQLHRRL